MRGFTNPAPYSSKGNSAEIYRSHRNKASEITTELEELQLGQAKKAAPKINPSKVAALVEEVKKATKARELEAATTRLDDTKAKK